MLRMAPCCAAVPPDAADPFVPTATQSLLPGRHATESRSSPAESVTAVRCPGLPPLTVSTTASGVFFALTTWTPRPTTKQLAPVAQAMALKVDVPGGTTRNVPGVPAVTGTTTSLYFPLEVEATLVQLLPWQSMELTEVVAKAGCTVDPVETAPLAVPRPPAVHAVAEEHETVCSVVVPWTTSGMPGVPPVIDTTTPWPPPTPTASQLVDVAHETESSAFVPLTTCVAPGDPLVMVTTTPAPLGAFEPTATHSVAVGHEIDMS